MACQEGSAAALHIPCRNTLVLCLRAAQAAVPAATADCGQPPDELLYQLAHALANLTPVLSEALLLPSGHTSTRLYHRHAQTDTCVRAVSFWN